MVRNKSLRPLVEGVHRVRRKFLHSLLPLLRFLHWLVPFLLWLDFRMMKSNVSRLPLVTLVDLWGGRNGSTWHRCPWIRGIIVVAKQVVPSSWILVRGWCSRKGRLRDCRSAWSDKGMDIGRRCWIGLCVQQAQSSSGRPQAWRCLIFEEEKRTYVKMDHTSNLWVPPSNIRWDWGIVAVWEVAILLKVDAIDRVDIWEFGDLVICLDKVDLADMSMHTIIYYTRIIQWSMVCLASECIYLFSSHCTWSLRNHTLLTTLSIRFLPIYNYPVTPSILYTYTTSQWHSQTLLLSYSVSYHSME